ncbi:DUF3575 domain-containing protein [Sanyastnella coralliicola]|uniref:DUF3575 domain-containing protein n=1 Tax=Sanyastnella coralliicola TaxID=3069118 RepID=UPI0027BA802E|nr:DUF3575 domain-containing protein [Longitalea sp. SCSIO 12813]
MRRLLLLGVALLTVICVHAQHGLRLQNSYFLTGLPLFGAGYEYENNSSFTYGLHVEFGRYAYHQQDMINTAWESYSVQGVALLPEVRFYPWHDNQESVHRGVFIAGFGHARRLKEYLMEDPSVGAELRKGYSIGGGLAAGYRTACGDTPLYVEVLGGFGRASASFNTPSVYNEARQRAGDYDSTTNLYRFELAIGYRF